LEGGTGQGPLLRSAALMEQTARQALSLARVGKTDGPRPARTGPFRAAWDIPARMKTWQQQCPGAGKSAQLPIIDMTGEPRTKCKLWRAVRIMVDGWHARLVATRASWRCVSACCLGAKPHGARLPILDLENRCNFKCLCSSLSSMMRLACGCGNGGVSLVLTDPRRARTCWAIWRPPLDGPIGSVLRVIPGAFCQPLNADDPAVLIYTSGTTGPPQGRAAWAPGCFTGHFALASR